MHHGATSLIQGAGAAFAWGVQRQRMRREAYVQAVLDGRERDALNRRIRALEAALDGRNREQEAAEVDRRLRRMLGSLKG